MTMQEHGQAGTPLLERLRQRTAPGLATQARRAKLYNHPKLWYAKPDGDVVLLQGDPQNRAYYEDKGYTVLRPDEVQEWTQSVRPQVLAEQQRKARLVMAVRRLSEKHPSVDVVADMDIMTIDELETLLQTLAAAVGEKAVVVQGPTRETVAPRDPDEGAALVGSHEADRMQDSIKRARMSGRHYGPKEG